MTVVRWLDAAIKYKDPRPLITVEDVLDDLLAGEAHLHAGKRSCVVTKIRDFERTGERLIEAWLAGGDLGEIRDGIAQLEEIGRANGCTQAQVVGRDGWKRVLAQLGYEQTSITLRKILA